MSDFKVLDLVKPFAPYLPEITPPLRKVPFRQRAMWTAVTLLIFLVMSEIPLYGIVSSDSSDPLYWLRMMLASNRGTLMELGISPIVSASMVFQLLQGTQLLSVNMENKAEREQFQVAQKLFAFMLSIGQATVYVLTGMYGIPSELGVGVCLLLVLQLVFAAFLVILLDELLQKGYGLGSGISLFTATNVCEQIFWKAFAPTTLNSGKGEEFEGAVVSAIHLLFTKRDKKRALVHAFYRAELPNLLQLLSTLSVFFAVVYLQGFRLEIPIKSTRVRGPYQKNINLGKSKELENFIHDTIILGSEESFDSDFRSILKICFKFANSTEMLSLLYIKILNSEILKTNQLLGFWDEYFYSVNFSENFFTFNEKIKSLSGSESIFKFFWNNISNKNVKKYLSKIEKLLDDNQNDLFNCYFNSLCESLEHSDAERLCVIADYFKDKVDIIYPENEDVYSIMVNLYDVNDAMSLASIDNSLNKFVYFIRDCPEGTTKFRFENINYLIYWVNLLAKVNGNDIDLIVLIDLLCLFTSDYLFFHNDASKDLDNSEKLAISEAAEDILFTLKDELSSILIKEIGNKTSLISAIFSIEEMESETIKSVHESMEGSLHDIIRFYYAKLYQEILTSLGKKSADGKPFPKDISKKISKELIKPKKFLKVLAMAPLYEIIIVSDDLEFFKKTILSEVIGYGGVNSTGLDEFFINLQLLNTVLTISGCSAIPGVQLNMLVRRFKQWLDAEIAYDLEFMPARMNIINFFNIYLSKFGFTTLDHEFEFIVSDLFINSLSIVSNSEIDADFETNCEKQDSTSYELGLNINLNICCLKFFSFLETTKDDNDFLIKEISDEMSEELIKSMMGIFKNRYITKFQVNQGLLLNISFYKKLFKGSLLNFEALKEHYGSLVESFKSIENNHNIRLVEFKRSMIFIIGKLTNKISRDTSIELALNVTSLTKDEDIQNKMFKIPQNFVDIISDTSGIEDYIEYESFNSLYNYLWSWIQIFECFSENMPSLLQKKYLEQLPENSIESLLNIIFKQIDVGKDELINSKNEDSLVSEITNYDVCSTGSTCSLREIKIILLHLYYTVLTKFRFKGSEWFRDLRNVHTKSKIENFTAKYISPTIIEDLMKDLQEILIKNQVNEQFKDSKETQADKDEEDFNLDDIHSVKFSKGSHEIKSQYVVDEEKTEIGFKVPRLFPLSNIVVNAPSRMAVKEVTWQSWILQCQNLMNKINSNNATQSAASLIFDAVDLFDKNFRLHFKGFQECAICYSILDAYDKTLPNKSCHTCHNKFHGACLLKWFKSSGDYSCPLCRCKFQLHSKRQ